MVTKQTTKPLQGEGLQYLNTKKKNLLLFFGDWQMQFKKRGESNFIPKVLKKNLFIKLDGLDHDKSNKTFIS